MLGRLTASLIAAASAASFLPHFPLMRYGGSAFTNASSLPLATLVWRNCTLPFASTRATVNTLMAASMPMVRMALT